MKHTIEIGDSKGNTMLLSVIVDDFLRGGSWRSLKKGMICHNSGPVKQVGTGGTFSTDWDLYLYAGGKWGIKLGVFLSHFSANDEGTGELLQPWVLGLEPGGIEWSLVWK